MTASATIPAADISGNITGNAANVTGTVPVANGGTGATTLTGYVKGTGTTAMTASATIPAADISGNITGNAANVTGTVAVANGGTGAITAAAARTALGAAASGANGDITSLTNLTTDLSIAQGGTGASTATAALTNLLPSQAGNSGDVLTSNGTAASWQAPAAVTLDYALAGKSLPQYFSTTDGDVTWSAAATTLRGAITLDATGTYFTLKAGKTYELQAALFCWFTSNNSTANYAWMDNTNNYIGSSERAASHVGVTYSALNASVLGFTITVITPAVDTQVKLRVYYANISSIDSRASYARIIQLP
jgi:hypothetical protein